MSQRLNAVCYDLEIINAVPDKKRKREKGINYCQGWEDHRGMGVACVCCFDLWTREPRVFTKGNFDEMMDLFNNREEIIGYYSSGFDDKVLKAAGFNVTTTYDMCVLAKAKCNEPNKWVRGQSQGGFGLGEMAFQNGFGEKREDGWKAPLMWQLGQYGRVIDYCLDDAMKTYKLFMKRHELYVHSYKRTISLGEPKSFRRQLQTQQDNERARYLRDREVRRSEVAIDAEFVDNDTAQREAAYDALPEAPSMRAFPAPTKELSANEEARLESERELQNLMNDSEEWDFDGSEEFVVAPQEIEAVVVDELASLKLGKIPW